MYAAILDDCPQEEETRLAISLTRHAKERTEETSNNRSDSIGQH